MSSVPKLLEKVLDYTTLKQKIISKNIANISTVNYKREDVKFEEFLQNNINQKLKITSSGHINNTGNSSVSENQTGFEIETSKGTENNSGANNVDIDVEMAAMAQNSILFRFAARKLNTHYSALQNVIRGGSR